jgi:hypothetical protein
MLTAYTLDAADRIVAVSDSWDRFALENEGAGACASHVVGARLSDSIAGDAARMFMTSILMRVRVSGAPETVPYRCDSETTKRYYTMTLTPQRDGHVEIVHDLDREERGAVSVRIRTAPLGSPGKLRCSVCCRIEDHGEWVDPFDGDQDQSYRVVHTVCPDCKVSPMSGFRMRQARERAGAVPKAAE